MRFDALKLVGALAALAVAWAAWLTMTVQAIATDVAVLKDRAGLTSVAR